MMKKGEGSTHLPVESWTQIFYLLAVKLLFILRSICKSFLSIVDDSDFVWSHLRSFPANLHQTLTLVDRREIKTNIWKISYEIRESNGFTLHEKLDPGSAIFDVQTLTGSLDGLLLMSSDFGRPEVGTLWNPSTREIRHIPLPNPLSKSNVLHGMRLSGLAYDSSCQDYKVLYISYEYKGRLFLDRDALLRPVGVWVYGVKTHSWTTVNMENSGIMSTLAHSWGHPKSLFFEGALLGIEGWYSSGEYSLRMVRFEVGTNKFRYYTNLPLLAGKNINRESRVVTLDGGSTLGLYGWEWDDHYQASIWEEVALEGDASLWVRRCVIPQYPVRSDNYRTCVRVSKNGELMSVYTSDGTLKVFTYNLGTRHCQQYSLISLRRTVLYEAAHYAYIQSLIPL